METITLPIAMAPFFKLLTGSPVKCDNQPDNLFSIGLRGTTEIYGKLSVPDI